MNNRPYTLLNINKQLYYRLKQFCSVKSAKLQQSVKIKNEAEQAIMKYLKEEEK